MENSQYAVFAAPAGWCMNISRKPAETFFLTLSPLAGTKDSCLDVDVLVHEEVNTSKTVLAETGILHPPSPVGRGPGDSEKKLDCPSRRGVVTRPYACDCFDISTEDLE